MIERDELLKMAREAGATVVGDRFLMNLYDLHNFKDAILERAALECQAFGGIISGDECAENIRALKTKE